MKWRKLGKIFEPTSNLAWMHTHASVPFVGKIEGDRIKVFFSSRNTRQESSVGYLWFDIKTLQVLEVSNRPVLTAGDLGCFDDSGVMGCCIVNCENVQRMYYIGWNLGVTVPFRNSIGVAESYDGGTTFKKKYLGPILDRTKEEPHFVASCCVLKDDELYKIWYLSCTGWFKGDNGKVMHRYHIKYAESQDGIDWHRNGTVAIDYRDEHEYAVSVPRVIKDKNGIYRMWFSSRASKDIPTYRIRYAESKNGINWARKDEQVGIDVSGSGWDSEMMEYPYVFFHSGRLYMLYNGNNYGLSGFGLAVMDSSHEHN